MEETLGEVREGLVETMGRITSFWGFGKVMGQLYSLLYMSPRPLALDEMAGGLAVSKGNVSVNIRALERWNMVKRIWVKGDRKDYYEAETDFWKIVRGVMKEREKKEFDQALSSVSGLLNKSRGAQRAKKDPEVSFYVERLKKLEEFIKTMDRLVAALLTFEDLKRNVSGLAGRK